jgi:hypothetical protein
MPMIVASMQLLQTDTPTRIGRLLELRNFTTELQRNLVLLRNFFQKNLLRNIDTIFLFLFPPKHVEECVSFHIIEGKKDKKNARTN